MLKQIPLKIKNVEKKEKKGSHGAWRKEFCNQYVDLVSRIRHKTEASLKESLRSEGKSITCREGCTYCCFHYVTVSLAHGLTIVEFLYKNKKLLKKFLVNYEKWHEKGYSIASSIDDERIKATLSSDKIDLAMEKTRPLSSLYLETQIPCPFLINNRCSIYNVRPLSCSGHYSVSPPRWCVPNSVNKPTLYNLVPEDEDLISIMRLADPRLLLYELSLPIMITKILADGSLSIMSEVM